MTRIAILGHSSDVFLISHIPLGTIKNIVNDTIFNIKRSIKDVVFNIGQKSGISLWAAQACLENEAKFSLYFTGSHLSEEEEKEFEEKTKTFYTHSLNYKTTEEMLDESDSAIVFWAGKRIGMTFDSISYLLGKSKYVLNAINDLKPILREDLENGWTPSSHNDR